jgi:hypothetical protein
LLIGDLPGTNLASLNLLLDYRQLRAYRLKAVAAFGALIRLKKSRAHAGLERI